MNCYKCVYRAIEKTDKQSYCINKEKDIGCKDLACECYDPQTNFLPGAKKELTDEVRRQIKQDYDEVYNEEGY